MGPAGPSRALTAKNDEFGGFVALRRSKWPFGEQNTGFYVRIAVSPRPHSSKVDFDTARATKKCPKMLPNGPKQTHKQKHPHTHTHAHTHSKTRTQTHKPRPQRCMRQLNSHDALASRTKCSKNTAHYGTDFRYAHAPSNNTAHSGEFANSFLTMGSLRAEMLKHHRPQR